jgi:hypothetical protein
MDSPQQGDEDVAINILGQMAAHASQLLNPGCMAIVDIKTGKMLSPGESPWANPGTIIIMRPAAVQPIHVQVGVSREDSRIGRMN